MDAYIERIGAFIQANQEWAGPITFLLTLGESMLIIGLLIPATALLLATGGKPALLHLKPWYRGPRASDIASCIQKAEASIAAGATRYAERNDSC